VQAERRPENLLCGAWLTRGLRREAVASLWVSGHLTVDIVLEDAESAVEGEAKSGDPEYCFHDILL